MSTREQLDAMVSQLPAEKLRRLLEIARKLADPDYEEWELFTQAQFARAYGPDEPDYSEADLKPGESP